MNSRDSRSILPSSLTELTRLLECTANFPKIMRSLSLSQIRRTLWRPMSTRKRDDRNVIGGSKLCSVTEEVSTMIGTMYSVEIPWSAGAASKANPRNDRASRCSDRWWPPYVAQLRGEREVQSVGRLAAMGLEEAGRVEEGDQGQLEGQRSSQNTRDPTVGKARIVVWVPAVRGATFRRDRSDTLRTLLRHHRDTGLLALAAHKEDRVFFFFFFLYIFASTNVTHFDFRWEKERWLRGFDNSWSLDGL